MRYDINPANPNDNVRTQLLLDAAKEGDECPVDDICDSIPVILQYVRELEEKLRNYKNFNAKLSADLLDAERRINNAKSQKSRRANKRRR